MASAWLAGWFAMKGWTQSVVPALAASLVAQAVVFVPGLIWLGFFLGSADKALTFGLYPFIVGGLFKSALAAAIALGLSRVRA